MPPPPKKKQRKEDTPAPVKIAAAPPVSLPPPIMPYHPHLVPSYYPVYPQHPYFLAIHPQPPISPSLSPTLPCSNPSSTTTTSSPSTITTTTTLINNNNKSITTHSPSALTPSYSVYPYPIQLSPQMHPNPPTATPLDGRHNSISSTGTTADEREQARKVSHSAIERRRRERINDKIMQLKDLIPSCAERDNLHKMTILQSAIDYIGYLKGLVDELKDDQQPEFQMNLQQQPKSMLPKEAEKFTSQFSLDESKKREEPPQHKQDEDDWSSCSSPTNEKRIAPPVTSLKPKDVMGLSSQKTPPKIVIDVQDAHPSPPIADRNMNLENILC
ncbi:HLH-domain-containing protein [Backusella circina FSU 941]|nr:HLH-domain-containing protein [Backusella circina FSU 941]